MKTALAIDVGSSSAKAVLGMLTEDGLSWEEVYRFEHRIQEKDDGLYWDLPTIVDGVDHAVEAARSYIREVDPQAKLDSVAVDTWGVDYVWVDAENQPLAAPHSYRDPRGSEVFDDFLNKVSAKDLFEATGNQAETITTCVQMFAELKRNPQILERADHFLFLPDYLCAHLGGRGVAGAGIASTSGLADPQTKIWSPLVREALGLPHSLYPTLVPEESVVGEVDGTEIIRAGSHDTACAVAALGPVESGTAFISAGSWSLAGLVTEFPIISEAARAAGLTNETCTDGRNRLLLNMTGLWLIQESRRQWEREGKTYSFQELTDLAEQAESLGVVFDPNEPSLSQPGDLPSEIARLTKQRYGVAPEGVGQTVRLIMESLAAAHARVFEQLTKLTGYVPTTIRMVGGGIQDRLLCQYTADACGKRVVAGPVEASALGSVITQLAVTRSDVSHVLDNDTTTYEPTAGNWEQIARRFKETEQQG